MSVHFLTLPATSNAREHTIFIWLCCDDSSKLTLFSLQSHKLRCKHLLLPRVFLINLNSYPDPIKQIAISYLQSSRGSGQDCGRHPVPGSGSTEDLLRLVECERKSVHRGIVTRTRIDSFRGTQTTVMFQQNGQTAMEVVSV